MTSEPQEISEKLGRKILGTLDEIDEGFKRVMLMYTIAFYLGIGLIVFSFVITVLTGNNIFLIFGGAGIADVVTFFIFKPAEELQKSRGNLAQVTSGFLTWFSDTHNWNYAVSAEFKNGKDNIDLERLEKISKISVSNTIAIMMAIEVFVAGKSTDKSNDKIMELVSEIKKNTT